MRAETGLFIVFEGGDGAGKTTQTRMLADWLDVEQRNYIVTRQPGGGQLGKRIREILLDPQTGDLDPRAEALLYAADKAQHLAEIVLPALRQQKIVICDRYIDSMLAYQGAGRGVDVQQLAWLANWATNDLRPNLTVLLDVDPSQAVETKTSKDRVEQAPAEFHARVRQGFLNLANADPEHYLVVNARLKREEIAAKVRERLKPLIAERQLG